MWESSSYRSVKLTFLRVALLDLKLDKFSEYAMETDELDLESSDCLFFATASCHPHTPYRLSFWFAYSLINESATDEYWDSCDSANEKSLSQRRRFGSISDDDFLSGSNNWIKSFSIFGTLSYVCTASLLSSYYDELEGGLGISSFYIAMEKAKVLPQSIPSEWIYSSPSFNSISALEIMSPRPIPSWFISAVLKSLPNLLQSFGISSAVIPLPLSHT